MDTCSNDIPTLVSVLTSILFIVSETLPYTSKVKGNGILEVISDVLAKYLKKTNTPEEIV